MVDIVGVIRLHYPTSKLGRRHSQSYTSLNIVNCRILENIFYLERLEKILPKVVRERLQLHAPTQKWWRSESYTPSIKVNSSFSEKKEKIILLWEGKRVGWRW